VANVKLDYERPDLKRRRHGDPAADVVAFAIIGSASVLGGVLFAYYDEWDLPRLFVLLFVVATGIVAVGYLMRLIAWARGDREQ
jgi:hypothetical protein